MVDCIFIRPRFDSATNFSFKWCGQLIEEIKEDVTFVDLKEKDAVRNRVEATIEAEQPEVIVHFDHGQEDALIGNDSEAIIDSSNVELLSNRIMFTMSCLSSAGLGVEAWRKGCTAYIGYSETFGFTVYDEQLFCEAANYGMVLYAKGETNWGTIKTKVINKFNQLISEAVDPWSKVWLSYDRDAWHCWNGETPTTSDCIFRQTAIKLFGSKLAWKLTRKLAIGMMLFLIGWGITLHAIANELYYKTGDYSEILKFQGEWIGLALALIGFILLTSDYINWLRHEG